MYPGTAKMQARPDSPQFVNFSPPADYPASMFGSKTPLTDMNHSQNSHHHSHSHTHNHNHNHLQQQQMEQLEQLQLQQQHAMRQHAKTLASSNKTRSTSTGRHMGNANTLLAGNVNGGGMMATAGGGSIGRHRGNDILFSDDIDSIEFCIPPPPNNGFDLNGDMLRIHGNASNGLCSSSSEAFPERQPTQRSRRGHSRRSNHKMDVEQQVKWSRKNIAATMERFEPSSLATHSSSSASSLEYGFAAGVVTPSTPSHQHLQQLSPTIHQQQHYGGSSAGGSSSNSNSPMAGAVGPANHVYSYAYYEPGLAKCHTNVPQSDAIMPAQLAMGAGAGAGAACPPKSPPPRNSIRALLAKKFGSKSNGSHTGPSTSSSSPSVDDRHTYTTRYGTTENLYEEVNEQKIRKVLSDNRIASAGVSGVSVKEEMRRVQHNHFRVLDELNLSLEALIMPPTPPDISPSQAGEDDDEPTTSAAAASLGAAAALPTASAATTASANNSNANSQRPRRGGLLGGASSSSSSQQRALSHGSLENLSTTLNSIELKDHAHSSCINPDFDEGDLDSGFSGSGSSSGASYNESLRYYKSTGSAIQNHNLNQQNPTTLPHNLRSCRLSTASGTSTSKSSMASSEEQGITSMMTPLAGGCAAAASNGILGSSASPFDYLRRCSDAQRASSRCSAATGAKPKKNFWTIKP